MLDSDYIFGSIWGGLKADEVADTKKDEDVDDLDEDEDEKDDDEDKDDDDEEEEEISTS